MQGGILTVGVKMINNKIKIMFGMMLVLLVLPMVLGQASFTFKQNDIVDLKVPVANSNNSQVTTATNCTILIRDSRDNLLVNNEVMTFSAGGIYNFTLNNTQDLGFYPVYVSCTDGVDTGFTTFTVEITTTGKVVGLDDVFIFGFILLFAIILGVLGEINHKEWMIFFSGMILLILGLFFANNGLSFVNDNLLQQAIAWVLIGVGTIVMLNPYLNYDERLS